VKLPIHHAVQKATMNNFAIAVLLFAATASAQNCAHLTGTVRDSNGGAIPGAALTLDDVAVKPSDDEGRYSLPCLTPGNHHLHIVADAFAPSDVTLTGRATTLDIALRLAEVDQSMEVGENTESGLNNQETGGSKTLSKTDLAGMADDPDDFKRELQVLAAAGGGNPGNATISVDGFQGSSAMPPKGSIAFIRINPDLFSSEYGNPPYEGGRIEIFTKPAAGRIHGALFTTFSQPFMNASDPFATSKAPLGKHRYGFDLSMPIKPNKLDLSLNLEKRDIDTFGVVNAVTLDANKNLATTIYNVPTAQHLWIASARSGVQWNKQNLSTFTYSAAVNHFENVNVGGTVLQEAGYDNQRSDHSIRASLVSTLSPRLVHEGRIAFNLGTTNNTSNSTAPGLNISGAFTGGGSNAGATKLTENVLEVNDDVLYSRGKHSFKAGIISFTFFDRNRMPSGFNGTYTFGGGIALPLDANGNPTSNTPVQITGLEQYRRALLGYQGGAATTYSVTTGSPVVNFTQVRSAIYLQDQWKVTNRFQLALGLRYAVQNDPSTWGAISPRLGMSWSPDKKQKLVLRGRIGLFSSQIRTEVPTQLIRLDGTHQTPATFYNATYGNPTSGQAGTLISTRYALPQHISHQPSVQSHAAVEYEFPRHWNFQANEYFVRGWNTIRVRNINTPTNGSPTGPRPFGPNQNILQFQQTGHMKGTVTFLGLDQHSLKRVQIFLGYLRLDLRSNAETSFTQPQSEYTDAGEFTRPTWLNTHRIFAISNLNLPYKLTLSNQFNATSGGVNNILTGADNNGDGTFNDRPNYATGPGTGVYATRFGMLTAPNNPLATGTTVNRNLGTLTWTVNLDTNLSRTFTLNSKSAQDHQQTVAFNLRSANLLNHTNVNAAGNVIGSPLFDKPLLADPGRRVEAGIRYSF
jgi:hypothetical protein